MVLVLLGFKFSKLQDDKVLGGGDSPLQGDLGDAKITEDPGKEDMFMDCPDELVPISDGKEAVPSVEVEKENSEEALESYAADDQGSVAGEYQVRCFFFSFSF